MMTEKTFERIALTDPPAGICRRCSELAMQHTPTGSTFAYCEHTGTGAMLTPGSDWYLVENVSAENFKQAVLLAVLEGEQRFVEAQTGGLTEQ